MSSSEESEQTESTQRSANADDISPLSSPIPEAGDAGNLILGPEHVPAEGEIIQVLQHPLAPPPSPEEAVAAADHAEDEDWMQQGDVQEEGRIQLMDLAVWQLEFSHYDHEQLLEELDNEIRQREEAAEAEGQQFDRDVLVIAMLADFADQHGLVGDVRERFVEWMLFLGNFTDVLPRSGLANPDA